MGIDWKSRHVRVGVAVAATVIIVTGLIALDTDLKQAVVGKRSSHIDATVSTAPPAVPLGIGPPRQPKRLLWKYSDGSIKVNGGYAVVGIPGGISVREARNGAERWHYRVKPAGGERAVYADIGLDLAMVATRRTQDEDSDDRHDTLRVFDLRTGRQRWSREIPQRGTADGENVFIGRGAVIVPADYKLTAFSPSDGHQLWRREDFNCIPESQLTESVLLVLMSGCRDQASLTVVDPTTGKTRLQTALPKQGNEYARISAVWSDRLSTAGFAVAPEKGGKGTLIIVDQQGRRLWERNYPAAENRKDDPDGFGPRQALVLSEKPDALCLFQNPTSTWSGCWSASTGKPLWGHKLGEDISVYNADPRVEPAGGDLIDLDLQRRLEVETGQPTGPKLKPKAAEIAGYPVITYFDDGVMVLRIENSSINSQDEYQVYTD
jgi:hypothetical protein